MDGRLLYICGACVFVMVFTGLWRFVTSISGSCDVRVKVNVQLKRRERESDVHDDIN